MPASALLISTYLTCCHDSDAFTNFFGMTGTYTPYTGSPTGNSTKKAVVTENEFAAHAANLDLWIGNCYFPANMANATYDAMVNWVSNGGGLVTGCHTCESCSWQQNMTCLTCTVVVVSCQDNSEISVTKVAVLKMKYSQQ